MFSLHAKLQQDCFLLGDFTLSKLLLMNDYHYPWFILVPKRETLLEIFDLSEKEQHQLIGEITCLSEAIKINFNADKINVAALGNQVPQLHIHVIARFSFDTAWPQPVWGRSQQLHYEKHQLLERIDKLKTVLHEKSALTFHWDSQWS